MNHDEKKQKFDEAIAEGQSFYSAQYGKVANNTRNLVMGIIATIWIVSYDNGHFMLPNGWLISAMIGCFSYLFCDLLHYFFDAIFYYNQTISLEKKFGNWDYLTVTYNNNLIKHSKKSYCWMWVKAVLFLIISALFIFGMVRLYI